MNCELWNKNNAQPSLMQNQKTRMILITCQENYYPRITGSTKILHKLWYNICFQENTKPPNMSTVKQNVTVTPFPSKYIFLKQKDKYIQVLMSSLLSFNSHA